MTSATAPIRVLLCDCHDASREAISDRLRKEADLLLVGEYSSPEAAVFDLGALRPDVVILNPFSVNERSLSTCESFTDEARCVVLTSVGSEEDIEVIEAAGAAVLLKSARLLELAPFIRELAATVAVA